MANIDSESAELIGYTPPKEMAMGGAYEAASRTSHELAMWNPPIMSADMEILPDKLSTEARVRDTMRNDAYVMNGSRLQQDSIVGEMFLLNSKPNMQVLGLDETWATEFQEEVEAKFTLFAESIRNFPDAQGHMTLTGLVRLAVGIVSMSGEVLASAEWLRDEPRPFNTALQMIDIDRLSTPYYAMHDKDVRGGIKSNRFGRALGYYIQKSHPSAWDDPEGHLWTYVPATKALADSRYPKWDRQLIIHIISNQLRANQARGISTMVSALKEMKMTKKFRDIVLQSAALNASYAASIESTLPSAEVFAQLGAGNDANSLGSSMGSYAQQYLSYIAQYSGSGKAMHIDGVKIPHFFPGTSLKLQNAGTPGGIGTDFEASMLRYTAANLGVSYEQLSKNYSDANYSNLRASLAETGKRMRVEKRLVADRFATSFFRLWLEEAINKGEITSMPRNAPNWYEGLNSDAYCQCDWIGANQGQIDELKETQAAVLRMKYKLSTLEDEQAKLGRDWRQTLRQNKREQALAQELGVDLMPQKDDNMMNASSGEPADTGRSNTTTKDD